MTACEIRDASPCDVALLAALQAACYAAGNAGGDSPESYIGQAWSARSWAEVLALPGSFALVAASRAEPVGFFLGQVLFEDCELLALGVLPAWRRRGLGRRLVEQGTRVAGRRGANRIQLEVAENNSGGQVFYRSLEFAVTGRRSGYYRATAKAAVDALILEKALSPGGAPD